MAPKLRITMRSARALSKVSEKLVAANADRVPMSWAWAPSSSMSVVGSPQA